MHMPVSLMLRGQVSKLVYQKSFESVNVVRDTVTAFPSAEFHTVGYAGRSRWIVQLSQRYICSWTMPLSDLLTESVSQPLRLQI